MSVADDYLALANCLPARPRPSKAGDGLLGDAKQQSKKRPRTEDKCVYKQQIRSELVRRREENSGGRGNKSWLKDFIYEKWPYSKKDAHAFSRRRQYCYNLIFANKRGEQVPEESGQGESHCGESQQRTYEDSFKNLPPGRGKKAGRGIKAAGRSACVKASQRKRESGGGRRAKCPEIGAELFQWFVDTIRHCKARVGNDILLAKAKQILLDEKKAVQTMVADGVITEDQIPQWPSIGPSWIRDWRKRWRVSWRTKSIVYKVPRPVLARRLGVFWRNVIRVRYYHSKMFPNKRLRCRAYDQKPMYFNQAGDQGTFACMDDWEVSVREIDSASRARFTVMTKHVDKDIDETMEQVAARSHGTGNPHRLGVLFKTKGSGERIRAGLSAPDDVLLQFGPKGSYRTGTVVEFLGWDLGDADGDGDMEMVFLDWFSAHLDDSVRSLIKDKGHVVMYIPGGATPWVATLDTGCHAPYQREYTESEKADHAAQLLAGASMPDYTRQAVMDRAMAAWKDIPHARLCENEWDHVGVTLPLDGSGDHKLRHQCVPFWHELDIPAARDRIKTLIDVGIRTGELQSWDQVYDLLESYDAHAPLVEGEDAGRERIGDPHDDDDDGQDNDGDDDEDDDGDDGGAGGGEVEHSHWTGLAEDDVEDAPMGHDLREPGASPNGRSGCAQGASSSSSTDGQAVASSIVGAASESAQPTLCTESSTGSDDTAHDPANLVDKLMKLKKFAEELKLSDASVMKVIENRTRDLNKLRSTTHPAVVQALREAGIARRQTQMDAAAERKREAEKLKAIQLETEKAKVDLAIAKTQSDAEARQAKMRLEEIQAQKRLELQRREKTKEDNKLVRFYLASKVCRRLLDFYYHKRKENAAQIAELNKVVASQAQRKAGEVNITVPTFLEPTRHLFQTMAAMCAAFSYFCRAFHI